MSEMVIRHFIEYMPRKLFWDRMNNKWTKNFLVSSSGFESREEAVDTIMASKIPYCTIHAVYIPRFTENTDEKKGPEGPEGC